MTTEEENGLFTTAVLYAALYHRGQVDKQGQIYLLHLMRVALAYGLTMKQRTCAVLHDILEDTDMSLEQLQASFPADYVETVIALTHTPTETRDDYYNRVKANPDALVIKVADVLDNQGRTAGITDHEVRLRLINKYKHAMEELTK